MSLGEYRTSLLFTKALDALYHLQSVADGRFAGATLRFALHIDDKTGRWQFLAGAFLLQEQEVPPRPPRDYPTVLLREEWVPLGNLFVRLAAATEEGVQFALGEVDGVVDFDYASGERGHTQDRFFGRTGCAEEFVYFESNARRAPTVTPLPAVAKGLPAYQSTSEATADWCFERHARHSGDFHDRGRLFVIAPETRARVAEVEIRERMLRAEIRTNDLRDGEVHVLFTASTAFGLTEAPVRSAPVALPQNGVECVEVVVPDGAAIVQLYIVDGENDLVLHYRSWCDPLRRSEDLPSATADLEQEVADGENGTVEFKPWPKRSDLKNAKVAEMIKTVVAFANTAGGRLYVGIDDEGNPQGLAPIQDYGKTPEEMLDEVRRYLDREIRNGIVEVPPFKIRAAGVHGQTVLIVEVRVGEAVPYGTVTNEIFIRRGASNRRPDPRGELAQLFASRSSQQE